MRLVLDNTVMSNFALVGRTDWVRDVWPDELVTSEEAWAELQIGVRLGRIPEIDWSWLTVLSLTDVERETSSELMPPLDVGEATCLALARSRGYAFLTDDRVARREARRLGVPLSGTIGLLKALVDDGRISPEEADEALQQMIALGYHSPVRSLSELR
jgi:predicted nucleic acid-binding protein